MKLLGATVLVLAIFIGSLYSGALVSTGVFSMLDQFEGSRGYFMKGLFPAMHADTAWGFTEDQIPDLEGTTVVVTGANSGLGFWCSPSPPSPSSASLTHSLGSFSVAGSLTITAPSVCMYLS